MSHPETATYSSWAERTDKFSTQSRAVKQHVRMLLFKTKDNLPKHIKHMFDEVTARPGKGKDKLIDNLFEKRNGKWEMNLTAPIFEQGKVRCYIYRDGT